MKTELRQHARHSVADNAYAAIGRDFSKVGRINNISVGGLSFNYTATEPEINSEAMLDILVPNSQFNLYDLPSKIVYDMVIPEPLVKNDSLNVLATRRCGIKFDQLDNDIERQLQKFLNVYARFDENIRCREEFLPFHVPIIGEEEIREVEDTLRSGWLTTGPKVRQFENDFREYVGCKHALAVNSGTAALHLALESIGLKPNDKVLVPTLTFTATAEVVCYFGATPVLVDVDPRDFNIGGAQIEEAIDRLGSAAADIKAIIPVHFCGYSCEMDEILEISAKHDIKVIGDAAHALPCEYKGKNIGVLGDMTAFSFYATKNITTGEGGMLTTNNDQWAERIKIMRLHGMNKDAWRRYEARAPWHYDIVASGFKYNLTDLAASIGVQQLKKSDAFLDRRRYIASEYARWFRQSDEVSIAPAYGECTDCSTNGLRHAWHLFPILIDPSALTIDRNRFIEELSRLNIGTSVHFIPLHLHKFYSENFNYKYGDFPVSEFYFERCISLPIFPKMTDRDIEDVVGAVFDITKKFRK